MVIAEIVDLPRTMKGVFKSLTKDFPTAMLGPVQPTRLLYYEDAYIKEFNAKVLHLQELNGQHRLILDQTAFYPMGGGQPADTGVIKAENSRAVIKDIRMENQRVVHLADEIEGKMDVGETVTGFIEWSRRYSLMRNHTLAHLMAEAVRRATGSNMEVVSSGLDVDKARLDFAYEGSLGAVIRRIEEICNSMIKEDRRVEIMNMPREEAMEYVKRFHESLKTLPPHVMSVRIVEIKGWHACACGGTHVKSVGEIGAVEVLRRMSKGKGVERIEFRAKTS